jgi:hypothetical protein
MSRQKYLSRSVGFFPEKTGVPDFKGYLYPLESNVDLMETPLFVHEDILDAQQHEHSAIVAVILLWIFPTDP